MDNTTTIPPTAAELWLQVRELDEMYWRVHLLGIDTGDMERIRKDVGDMATAAEKRDAVKCRNCEEALGLQEREMRHGLCMVCFVTRPYVKTEATNA